MLKKIIKLLTEIRDELRKINERADNQLQQQAPLGVEAESIMKIAHKFFNEAPNGQ